MNGAKYMIFGLGGRKLKGQKLDENWREYGILTSKRYDFFCHDVKEQSEMDHN